MSLRVVRQLLRPVFTGPKRGFHNLKTIDKLFNLDDGFMICCVTGGVFVGGFSGAIYAANDGAGMSSAIPLILLGASFGGVTGASLPLTVPLLCVTVPVYAIVKYSKIKEIE